MRGIERQRVETGVFLLQFFKRFDFFLSAPIIVKNQDVFRIDEESLVPLPDRLGVSLIEVELKAFSKMNVELRLQNLPNLIDVLLRNCVIRASAEHFLEELQCAIVIA